MVKHKLCELVMDINIYPRNSLSAVNVARLLDALESGQELPPIVVEKGTKRILDGVCRWKALMKHFGDSAETSVVERVCVDDNDAFLAAIELNSTHGMQLTPHELNIAAKKAEQREIPLEELSQAAHVPLENIQRRLNEHTAWSHVSGYTSKEMLKRPMLALVGKDLDETQVTANRMSGGMHSAYYINMIKRLIEAGLWEWGSARERNALVELFNAMKRVIKDAA